MIPTSLGADDGGESNLTYSWSASRPVNVNFSANGSNGAKTTTATFIKAGTYVLTVTIADAYGLTTSSAVSVTVDQTPTNIVVGPSG